MRARLSPWRATASLVVAALLVTAVWFGNDLRRPAAAQALLPARTTTRIMPLGDSITHGYPTVGGYRVALSHLLGLSGYPHDFVGSQSYGPPGFHDPEHEGHGRYRIDRIRAGVRRWLAQARPEVVLLMIGTNDFLGDFDTPGAPARLSRLLDAIAKARPTASVLVGSIPPITRQWCDCGARVAEYNAAIRRIADDKARAGYPVSFVDMSAVTEADLADGVHPNDLGHAKMADAWNRAIQRLPESPRRPGPTPATRSKGYWVVSRDGRVHPFGGARSYGSAAVPPGRPVVGMAPTPTGRGYWLAASDGAVFAFGDARFHGSAGGLRLSAPIVGIAAVPTGRGYWLVAADGGVFSFGDARFFGSTGSLRLARPIVGIAATPSGGGYWFVAADGGVFSFGDARFAGAPGGASAGTTVVSMAPTPTGDGYWLAASDGRVFAFGDAEHHGAAVGKSGSPVVGIAATDTGEGYVLATGVGEVRAFGDAAHEGSLPAPPRRRGRAARSAAPPPAVAAAVLAG